MKFQHLVLTRYTLKRPPWSYDAFTPEWLEERIRLFETYCVPGLARQTSDNFSWLVLCDEATDPHHIERPLENVERVPQLRVGLPSLERGHGAREVPAPRVEEDWALLITTRLDSDDFLNSNAVPTTNDSGGGFSRSRHERWVLSLPSGYRFDEAAGRIYSAF